MAQIKLGDNPEKIKAEIKEEEEREKQQQELFEKKEKEFEAKYKYGSTTVFLKDNKYYFWGDIIHCEEEAIFHNARQIKEEMINNKTKMGRMNYNDLPTFEKNPQGRSLSRMGGGVKSNEWDYQQKERRATYQEDLFVFEGEEIKLIEKFSRIEETRKCPKCNSEVKVWEVIGFTKDDGTKTPSTLYGFCDTCVKGFNFEVLSEEDKKIIQDLEGI